MGLFITLEGPEGCGKSTQMRLLVPFLQQLGHDVVATREPGGTRIGDRVRAILLDPAHTEMLASTEFLLFSAARAQHVGQVIRPHLERGGVVLCDRFADSSLAYQGYGYGRELEALRAISRYATDGLLPDVTLLLDLPVEVGLQRKQGGSGDAWNRMEQKLLDYHDRVRAGYLSMAAAEPQRWVVLDGSQSRDQVQSAIREALLPRLGQSSLTKGGME
ncbi:MAG TPA: dTMP kinase [Anaerolineae bacterium]|nr:dTMP kinase [Anaerolineae bacterium]